MLRVDGPRVPARLLRLDAGLVQREELALPVAAEEFAPLPDGGFAAYEPRRGIWLLGPRPEAVVGLLELPLRQHLLGFGAPRLAATARGEIVLALSVSYWPESEDPATLLLRWRPLP
ncbi:MAG: hypothetical protein KatS3mg102_2208 [Planctomycetota bacterium]|nr:MAG: hypothetical protein KatS3mg102_2208 [Planctomycetota bacterium]